MSKTANPNQIQPPMTSNGALGSFETGIPSPNTSATEVNYTMQQALRAPEVGAPVADQAAATSRLEATKAGVVNRLTAAKEALFSDEAAQARSEFARVGGVALTGIVSRAGRSLGVVEGRGDNARLSMNGVTKLVGSAEKGGVQKAAAKAAVQSIRPSDVYRVGKSYMDVAKTTNSVYKQKRQAQRAA